MRKLEGGDAVRAGASNTPHPFAGLLRVLAGLDIHEFDSGFYPTHTPQEFESFRTNPQEPSPARTARCQVVDFQQTP